MRGSTGSFKRSRHETIMVLCMLCLSPWTRWDHPFTLSLVWSCFSVPGLSEASLSSPLPKFRMPAGAMVLRYEFGAKKWCRSIGTPAYHAAPHSPVGVWATTPDQVDVWSVRTEREVIVCCVFTSVRDLTRQI